MGMWLKNIMAIMRLVVEWDYNHRFAVGAGGSHQLCVPQFPVSKISIFIPISKEYGCCVDSFTDICKELWDPQ